MQTILNEGYKGKGKQQQMFYNSQLLSYINVHCNGLKGEALPDTL